MTIGLALIAEKRRAIVLVSDRSVTDENENFYEGQETKRRDLGYGWHLVFEGGYAIANLVTDRIRDRLAVAGGLGADLAYMTLATMKDHVRTAVLGLRREEADREGVPLSEYELDLGLLVIGFDEKNRACAFQIDGRADLEDAVANGRCEIGSGAVAARQRLIWLRPRKTDTLDRALYNALDAKRHAQSNNAVGRRTDVWVLTYHQQDELRRGVVRMAEPIRIPADVRRLIHRVFVAYTATPYEEHHVPPRGWRPAMVRYARRIMRGERPSGL